MNLLVTGGAGYLGSLLVPMLLARGYKVRVLDRLLFGSESLNPVCKHSDFELMIGDVRDMKAGLLDPAGVPAIDHETPASAVIGSEVAHAPLSIFPRTAITGAIPRS